MQSSTYYNALHQHVNSGNDQNIHAGNGHIFTGEVNVAGSFVQMVSPANVAGPNAHRTLWDAVAGIGASHRAEQQFSHGECLEGTREEALRIIHDWRKAREQDLPICWLSGAAGVGKSAIAMTVAKSCEDDGLVSSFFLFRSDPRRNNPSALMLAIAHGLTVTIPSLRKLVNQRISDDPRILEARIEDQFTELVLKPALNQGWQRRMWALAAELSLATREPTLVIIDGLDECSDAAIQLRILAAIADSYRHPPRSPLRFLICSRSESWLRQAFSARPLRDITRSIVLDDKFSPAKDIERYLAHEFERIRKSPEYGHITFPNPWPSRQDLDCLVQRSDGQFVYVVTAVQFVKIPHYHPMKQLRVIIDNAPIKRPTKSPYPELDSLYHVVLHASSDHDRVLSILAAILVIPHEQMDSKGATKSPEWLELLLGLSSGEVILALRAMHSVLKIRGPKDPIRVYHTSFTDYLSDQTRSGEFYILEKRYDLAQQWLQALSRTRIREYSLYQLYGHSTILFFTGWIGYCVSLPEPTPALLDDLGNLDISALFFCMLVLRLRKDSFGTPTWDEAFGPMVTWLSSSADPTAGILIKRFREQPKAFHIESDNVNPEYATRIVEGSHSIGIQIILCAVSVINGCDPGQLDYSDPFDDGIPPLRVTGCYCHDFDVDPSIPSHHPGHHAYQSACLRILEGVLPSKNLLDSSLLLHCPFGPELFSLCETFFRLLRTRLLPEAPRNSREYRTKFLEWLKTCPDCYAREAEALRAQVVSLFSEAGEADEDAEARGNTQEPA